MADGIPKFTLYGDKYPQTTYVGRLIRCFDMVDPSTLFISDKKLKESLDLLDAFKHGTLKSGVTDNELWHARKIKEAIIHPDTGKKIFMPFRMSGYVPFGTVTVVGMILPAPSLPQVIFWQWMNQSHNAGVNYSNRNASKETPTSLFVKSYLAAVSAAVGIAVGLSLGIKNARFLTERSKKIVQRFVAYPATCTANVANVFLMRQHEIREGIDIDDGLGNVVGASKIAARKAVKETALTRVLLPAPILIVPPVVMAFLERTKFLTRRPYLNLPMNALVCVLSFGISLPFAIALFPQRSTVDVAIFEIRAASPYVLYKV
eukprot:gene5207-5861_t